MQQRHEEVLVLTQECVDQAINISWWKTSKLLLVSSGLATGENLSLREKKITWNKNDNGFHPCPISTTSRLKKSHFNFKMACRDLHLLGGNSIPVVQNTSELMERLPCTVLYLLQLGENVKRKCALFLDTASQN